MKYAEVVSILNQHIFDNDKHYLIDKLANNPERYVGLFRPTKPKAKSIQNLLDLLHNV